MTFRRTLIWSAVAVLGVALTTGATITTTLLSQQPTGLSSEPVLAGNALAPERTQGRTPGHQATKSTVGKPSAPLTHSTTPVTSPSEHAPPTNPVVTRPSPQAPRVWPVVTRPSGQARPANANSSGAPALNSPPKLNGQQASPVAGKSGVDEQGSGDHGSSQNEQGSVPSGQNSADD